MLKLAFLPSLIFARHVLAASQEPQKAPVSLAAIVQQVIARGSPGIVPGSLAELIGVPRDSATQEFETVLDQSNDGLAHRLKLLVDRSPDKKTSRPIGIVLKTTRLWPGNQEGYWFRVSLNGELEKAMLIQVKLDEKGDSIKGSGGATEQDTSSLEIKKRFQHELDFWLKKTYLKKEWRSAEFSDGKLKKAKDTVPH
jgi:hypothetical protein